MKVRFTMDLDIEEDLVIDPAALPTEELSMENFVKDNIADSNIHDDSRSMGVMDFLNRYRLRCQMVNPRGRPRGSKNTPKVTYEDQVEHDYRDHQR